MSWWRRTTHCVRDASCSLPPPRHAPLSEASASLCLWCTIGLVRLFVAHAVGRASVIYIRISTRFIASPCSNVRTWTRRDQSGFTPSWCTCAREQCKACACVCSAKLEYMRVRVEWRACMSVCASVRVLCWACVGELARVCACVRQGSREEWHSNIWKSLLKESPGNLEEASFTFFSKKHMKESIDPSNRAIGEWMPIFLFCSIRSRWRGNLIKERDEHCVQLGTSAPVVQSLSPPLSGIAYLQAKGRIIRQANEMQSLQGCLWQRQRRHTLISWAACEERGRAVGGRGDVTIGVAASKASVLFDFSTESPLKVISHWQV